MKNSQRYMEILNIALEAVFSNRFRSFLTALGIIFGVAAVIAMMSIGKGARQEILEQIKLVGVNNIVISAKNLDDLKQESEAEEEGKSSSNKFSPGLNLSDADIIGELIPAIKTVSPEAEYQTVVIQNGVRKKARLRGVVPNFFDLFNLKTQSGILFGENLYSNSSPVCVIGSGIKNKFFPKEDAIGKYIKCDYVWFKVIGVLENQASGDLNMEASIETDYNNDVFVPISTLNSRYKDRSKASKTGGGSFSSGNRRIMVLSSSSRGDNFGTHQLNRLVVQVKDSKDLSETAKLIIKTLKRRHNEVNDFEVKVPELLLKQEQKNKEIFNIVLGAIASISLIVGGIGIMNIMLASVMERIKEIGVRRSIGATRKDIILQFLLESIFISVAGGAIGIILGIVLSKAISHFADIKTITSFSAIFISFGVAVAVGVIFGYMPAKKAAEQDPVQSLRHD